MGSHPNLQLLVGKAGLDRTLCAGLLNGNRGQVISKFDLSAVEEEAVLAVEATSLQEFARALQDWIERQNGYPGEARVYATRPAPARALAALSPPPGCFP
jgi:hypothetical protein